MAGYSVLMQRTAGAATSVGDVSAAAASPKREKIYEVLVGCEATPGDVAFLWQFQRTTAIGTRTAFTPLALDPADAAALAQAGHTHTVEPTYTANAQLLSIALNQRATFRWYAGTGRELVVPATANAGIGVKTPTASALAVTCTVFFEEQ